VIQGLGGQASNVAYPEQLPRRADPQNLPTDAADPAFDFYLGPTAMFPCCFRGFRPCPVPLPLRLCHRVSSCSAFFYREVSRLASPSIRVDIEAWCVLSSGNRCLCRPRPLASGAWQLAMAISLELAAVLTWILKYLL
jgi:hypothetical protein